MRDEAEQLEFVGVENHVGIPLARMRNIDRYASEWLANRSLLEYRALDPGPRGATRAALAAIIAAEP